MKQKYQHKYDLYVTYTYIWLYPERDIHMIIIEYNMQYTCLFKVIKIDLRGSGKKFAPYLRIGIKESKAHFVKSPLISYQAYILPW